jgi:hypothetical protein
MPEVALTQRTPCGSTSSFEGVPLNIGQLKVQYNRWSAFITTKLVSLYNDLGPNH